MNKVCVFIDNVIFLFNKNIVNELSIKKSFDHEFTNLKRIIHLIIKELQITDFIKMIFLY